MLMETGKRMKNIYPHFVMLFLEEKHWSWKVYDHGLTGIVTRNPG
jgi:hypothetical protein